MTRYFALVLLAGCTTTTVVRISTMRAPSTSKISDNDTFNTLVKAKCISCHGSEPRSEDNNLDLRNWDTLMELDGSKMWARINDSNPKRRMPKSGKMSNEQIELFRVELNKRWPSLGL